MTWLGLTPMLVAESFSVAVWLLLCMPCRPGQHHPLTRARPRAQAPCSSCSTAVSFACSPMPHGLLALTEPGNVLAGMAASLSMLLGLPADPLLDTSTHDLPSGSALSCRLDRSELLPS